MIADPVDGAVQLAVRLPDVDPLLTVGASGADGPPGVWLPVGALILIVNVCCAVSVRFPSPASDPSASSAWYVTVEEPTVVGVPDTVRVDVSNDRPAGRPVTL